jgi:hypothetical protein
MFRVAPKTLYDYELEEWFVPPHSPKRARTFHSPSGDSLAAFYFLVSKSTSIRSCFALVGHTERYGRYECQKTIFLALDS